MSSLGRQVAERVLKDTDPDRLIPKPVDHPEVNLGARETLVDLSPVKPQEEEKLVPLVEIWAERERRVKEFSTSLKKCLIDCEDALNVAAIDLGVEAKILKDASSKEDYTSRVIEAISVICDKKKIPFTSLPQFNLLIKMIDLDISKYENKIDSYYDTMKKLTQVYNALRGTPGIPDGGIPGKLILAETTYMSKEEDKVVCKPKPMNLFVAAEDNHIRVTCVKLFRKLSANVNKVEIPEG